MSQIIGQGTAATSLIEGGLNGTVASGQGYGGWQVPDIVANLRVDQAWGDAQVMGVLHQVNTAYYGSAVGVIEANGHPSDQWGWAAGAGLHINMPIPQDYIEGEVNYSRGVNRYDMGPSAAGASNQNFSFSHGSSQGFGIGSDCVYGGTVIGGSTTGTNCVLTTVRSVVLGYEHFWTPQWHESLTGAYMAESYNATANAILCSLEGGGNGVGVGVGTAAMATPGCNNNWSYWTVGSRLQWDVTKTFQQ